MVKELKVYGKNEAELKKLESRELLALLPSRARRTLKREGKKAVHAPLNKKIQQAINGKRKKPIKTHCRELLILPYMIGLTIAVYNGKEYANIIIIPEMIGHYIGEFAYTRKFGKHSGPGIGATKSSKAAKK